MPTYNEQEELRLKDLYSYELDYAKPEAVLDEFAHIASMICKTPISLITLLDTEDQHFISKKGIPINSTRREDSFCRHAMDDPNQILEIEDSWHDARFKDNPLVLNDPNIRFYAGAPLVTPSGNMLGTLCVIDTEPRKLDSEQRKVLQSLSKRAMEYLNRQRLIKKQQKEITNNAEKLKKLTDHLPAAVFQALITEQKELRLEFLSEGVSFLHPDLTPEKVIENPQSLFDKVHPDDRENVINGFRASYRSISKWEEMFRIVTTDTQWFLARALPEKQSDGSIRWYGYFENVTSKVAYQNTIEQIAFDISHVLRKPVTTLLGLTSAIEAEEEMQEAKIKEYGQYINQVSEELNRYTKKLNETYEQKRKVMLNNTGEKA
ncbi:GAF domain-containing protein [Luteirhabdus pelagi]|uniref:GAF domain-containing protein n=1 Tax=Luteirhabdus pelagi TaxID=2792783 RepID=UPI00193A7658|nr:GAF domain-containing protein [Luteirhabdus pelagi]